MDGTDYGMLWNGMDRDVRGECEGDEGTDCEDGDWVVKVDRIWDALCIKWTKLIGKYIFLAEIWFLGDCVRFG